MILDTSNKSITVVLSGAKNTSDANCFASWEDSPPTGGVAPPAGVVGRGSAGINTNGTSAATVVPAPTFVGPLSSTGSTSNGRKITLLSIYNADAASITATLGMLNGSITSTIGVFALSVGDTLTYVDGQGFKVTSSTGATKGSSTGGSANQLKQVYNITGTQLLASLANTTTYRVNVPYAYTILSARWVTDVPATTGSKLATVTLSTTGGALTGGVMSLTSANQTPTGNATAATAISGANATQTAGTDIIATISSVTAFVEGSGHLEVVVSNNS